MCARLSPTGISHHNLLPHFPSIRLSAVNSSPRPGIAPWSLNFSSKPLRLPGDLRPCPGYVWLWPRTVWFSCHLGSHRLAVSLSALYVSPLRQVPRCGDWTPVSVPPLAEGRFSPTNTLVFPSHSFVLPSFVWFYLFFSSGQVLLSTLSWCSARTSVSEMYYWCISGDGCTPCLPTPPPSCSLSHTQHFVYTESTFWHLKCYRKLHYIFSFILSLYVVFVLCVTLINIGNTSDSIVIFALNHQTNQFK